MVLKWIMKMRLRQLIKHSIYIKKGLCEYEDALIGSNEWLIKRHLERRQIDVGYSIGELIVRIRE